MRWGCVQYVPIRAGVDGQHDVSVSVQHPAAEGLVHDAHLDRVGDEGELEGVDALPIEREGHHVQHVSVTADQQLRRKDRTPRGDSCLCTQKVHVLRQGVTVHRGSYQSITDPLMMIQPQ